MQCVTVGCSFFGLEATAGMCSQCFRGGPPPFATRSCPFAPVCRDQYCFDFASGSYEIGDGEQRREVPSGLRCIDGRSGQVGDWLVTHVDTGLGGGSWCRNSLGQVVEVISETHIRAHFDCQSVCEMHVDDVLFLEPKPEVIFNVSLDGTQVSATKLSGQCVVVIEGVDPASYTVGSLRSAIEHRTSIPPGMQTLVFGNMRLPHDSSCRPLILATCMAQDARRA
eukprot:TRINITY_DN22405_c0_g1_i1.p1 TRINITY_DN22405_c0_g1~~TRINITY_DN22405_c0_g1_i1.p1  ORF type:complete len:224 (-),score=15.57 TRINITY_DN22405_c0_g1_i1:365-1036(-)